MSKTNDQLDQELAAIRAKLTEMFTEIMSQLADQRKIVDMIADHVELPTEDRPEPRKPPIGFA